MRRLAKRQRGAEKPSADRPRPRAARPAPPLLCMRKRSGPGQPSSPPPRRGLLGPAGADTPPPTAQPAGGAAPSPARVARQLRDSPPGARGSARRDPLRQSRPPLLALFLPGLQLCLSLPSPPAPLFPEVPGMVPGTPRTPRLREVRGLAGEGGGLSAARGAGRIFSSFYGSLLYPGTVFFCLLWELSGPARHRPVAP
ncbi:basic proline-rich protein-like [Trachypithecus francoisi]|uniref:basic proline-rich protein-like n=1 Tax=Trachypithecus francoisi TaxID=54180 RepID=UPI00141B5C80|nr:basic proline-rich protein-like [Trachypithecus francoisi]